MTKEDELTAGLRAELARVNARLAEQKRPQNCGTGYCSCVECVVEPAPVQKPTYAYTCKGCGALYLSNDVACDCRTPSLMRFDRHILVPDTTSPAPQSVPVKTYHDGKPWPVAPKPWVGLTKDDVESWDLPVNPTVFEFAQFIEAKLREKNGGAA